MTNLDQPIPVDGDCAVRLRIGSARQNDDHRWNQQLSLIKSTGAVFDNGAWYLWIDQPTLSTPQLEPLWRAVTEYGTHIRIDRIKPSTTREHEEARDAA